MTWVTNDVSLSDVILNNVSSRDVNLKHRKFKTRSVVIYNLTSRNNKNLINFFSSCNQEYFCEFGQLTIWSVFKIFVVSVSALVKNANIIYLNNLWQPLINTQHVTQCIFTTMSVVRIWMKNDFIKRCVSCKPNFETF
jgi:hypothetical protein